MEKAPGGLELITGYFTDFTAIQLQQLAALDELYRSWNDQINVISRKDIDSLYEKHVLHSLGIAAAFEFRKGMEVIDIGTGGGFPGIPLAIFFPETHFHLVDSIGKKIKVVDAVAEATGLKNVTTAHCRAEEIRNRKFDVAVSRAVAPLGELWRWAKPLLRKSGLRPKVATDPEENEQKPIASGLICLKGGDLHLEIAESGCNPRMIGVDEIFNLEYFENKFLLQVTVG